MFQPSFATPETKHKQGEGMLAIIRNFARFSLGLSAGIALIGALGNQFQVHFHREAREALCKLPSMNFLSIFIRCYCQCIDHVRRLRDAVQCRSTWNWRPDTTN